MGFRNMYYQKNIISIVESLGFNKIESVYETEYENVKIWIWFGEAGLQIDINECSIKTIYYDGMSSPEDILHILDGVICEVD